MTEESLEGKYLSMAQDRQPYLTVGERLARLSIPYVLTDLASNGSKVQDEKTPSYQSLTSYATRFFSNKLALDLFPINQSFFNMTMDNESEKATIAAGITKSQIMAFYQEVSQKSVDVFNSINARATINLHLLSLIITGNGCIVFTEDSTKFLGMDSYVVLRSSVGSLINVYTKENVRYKELPVELRSAILSSANTPSDEKELVPVYTGYELQDDGTYTISQEVMGIETMDKIEGVHKNRLPVIPTTLYRGSNESYGHGLLEETEGDFRAYNFLSFCRAKGAATMMDIKYLVKPGSMTDAKTLNESEIGEFLQGMEGDIVPFQIDKYADNTFITDVMREYEGRISRSFSIVSTQVRDSERTTATEVDTNSYEADLQSGGIYTSLSDELLLPMSYQILDIIDPSYSVGEDFKPKPVTGLEVLNKAGQLQKLVLFTQYMALPQSWGEDTDRYLDKESYALWVSTNLNLPIPFIRTNKEVADLQKSEQANAIGAATDEALATSMSKSLGNELGKNIGGI